MWVTKLRFKPEMRSKIEKILGDVKKAAQAKGEYFAYSQTEPDGIIFIFSDSKDRAYKRGMWFRHKVDDSISFDVYRNVYSH